MKFSNQFRTLLLAWQNCFESIKFARILLLFMLYAALQILVVLVLVFFAYPPFSALLVPIIRNYFGEPALHYPNNFVLLPTLFSWANLVLSGALGVVLIGVTTSLFSMFFQNKSVVLKDGIRGTLPKYFLLLVVWVVETSMLLLIFLQAPKLLAHINHLANIGTWPLQVITTLLAVVVSAMFAYTTALIILDKSGPVKAIARSLQIFKAYPVISILLIGVPTFVRMPIDLLASKTRFLTSVFAPETVGVLLIISILVSMFTNFFMVGSVTRYFLSVKEDKMLIY